MSDRPEFGEIQPRDYDAEKEAQRAEWRRRKQRQADRSRHAPLPMFYDDTPPPGRLRHGLIERHVPKPPKR
jgi:hypothetical protein